MLDVLRTSGRSAAGVHSASCNLALFIIRPPMALLSLDGVGQASHRWCIQLGPPFRLGRTPPLRLALYKLLDISFAWAHSYGRGHSDHAGGGGLHSMLHSARAGIAPAYPGARHSFATGAFANCMDVAVRIEPVAEICHQTPNKVVRASSAISTTHRNPSQLAFQLVAGVCCPPGC